MTPRLVVLVVSCVVVLAGCADPYEQDTPSRGQHADRPATKRQTIPQPTPADVPDKPQLPDPPASGELPGRVPPELRDEPTSFPEAGETPEQTLTLGARLYGNWTSATAAERFRAIAALSVGQARAELRQAAAQSGTDPQQQGLRSQASVETIDVDAAGAQRRALIVTRHNVDGPGLPDAGWRYQVTAARLEQRGLKWVISRWVPQP
jgi:hypothetical protein